MMKKYGRFYADWLDEHGHRRRQSFPTKKTALRFQTKMRAASAAKKDQAGKPQPATSSKPTRKTTTAKTRVRA